MILNMKLTATVKLLPTSEQRQSLLQTLERANTACNFTSELAWQNKVFSRVSLHHLTYYTIREQFGLSAQLAVQVIGKVSNSYKADKKGKLSFKLHGAIAYDSRILTWQVEKQTVSIWMLGGREPVAFTCGEYQKILLQYQQGESDLMFRNGEFYLFSHCEVPDDAPIDPEGFLGVDMGIKNIAVDSDGNIHAANHLLNARHRYRRLRRKLQKLGTKSAKRKLKERSGKESRFARDVNHCISKQLVKTAKGTGRGIALEDLSGICDRVTVSRRKRSELHSWTFHQLRAFIGYKAQHLGVPVVAVDPRNTSRQCSCCGHIDKANRPNQATFKCTSCGHASHADVNAAINIGRRAAVNPPNVGSDLGSNPA